MSGDDEPVAEVELVQLDEFSVAPAPRAVGQVALEGGGARTTGPHPAVRGTIEGVSNGRLAWMYGVGRIGFGLAVFFAPTRMGELFLGREPSSQTQSALRFYGTRDIVLGTGAVQALARGSDPGPWIAAGIGADLLDVAAQLMDEDTSPARRAGGLLAAGGAAAMGGFVLGRWRRGPAAAADASS